MYADYLQNRVELDPSYPGRDRYTIGYTRQPLPDPGAPAYSFDVLNLPPFTLIGHGVPVLQPFKEATPSMFVVQQVPLSGQPTLTGQFVSSPLFNPNSLGIVPETSNYDPAFEGAAVT